MPLRPASLTRTALRGVARSCAIVAWSVVLVGCASLRGPDVAAGLGADARREVCNVPDGRVCDAARAATELGRARHELGSGRPGVAIDILRALVAREPRYLPAHRLLQDLLVESPADWDLRQRYAEPPADAASSADAFYLAARIAPDRARQAALFDEALARDPGHAWALVGRAVMLLRGGDADASEATALRATRIAPELAMPWLFMGSMRLARGELDAAAAAYREGVRRDPGDLRGHLGLVAVLREQSDRSAASAAALAALTLAPGDTVVTTVAGDALVGAGVPARLREALDVLDAAQDAIARGASSRILRARLRLALGDADGALRACDAASGGGAGHADVAFVRRRAAVLGGDYLAAVEGFLATAPAALLAPDNLYAARWRALRGAAARATASRAGEDLLVLAAAMVAVGWRAESAIVFARAQAAASPDVRRRAARAAARERAFDRFIDDLALVARALRGAARREEDVADVGDVLSVIAGASRRRLGLDVTQGATTRAYPFLGEFAVSVASGGAFAREFDARGLLLLIGARRGAGTRLVVGRLALVRAAATAFVDGTEVTFDECWLETRGLPRELAGLGGGLAGLTMDRLVLIQLDAVLRGAAPATDVPFVPRPAATHDERVALDTPSAVGARIEASLASSGRLQERTLAAVRQHELGHVLDAQRMLPLLAPPWRALGLVVRSGFDGAAVESRLEARAAVIALAGGTAPRAALASLVGFLPRTDGATAHVRGYVEVVRAMVSLIASDPSAFPSIRRDRNILQQLDGLTPDEATELGRRLLRGM